LKVSTEITAVPDVYEVATGDFNGDGQPYIALALQPPLPTPPAIRPIAGGPGRRSSAFRKNAPGKCDGTAPERIGRKKAKSAIARKLATILWAIWSRRKPFETRLPGQEAAVAKAA
jgi:hypothetical protein